MKLVNMIQSITPFSLFEENFLFKILNLGVVKQIPKGWKYDVLSSPDRFYIVLRGTFEFTYEESKGASEKANKDDSVSDLKPFVVKDKQISMLDRIKIIKQSEASKDKEGVKPRYKKFQL